MYVVQICGSYGEQCGIARYSAYVSAALDRLGVGNEIVRTTSALDVAVARQKALNPAIEIMVLVQHEYGIYDYLSPLAASDTTSGILSSVEALIERGAVRAAGFIMHTIVVRDHVLNFANKQIFSARIPIYHLNRVGAAQAGAQFLEHGVYVVEGSNLDNVLRKKISIPDFARRQLSTRSIGSFGLLSANKMPTRVMDLASTYGLSVKGNFATKSPELGKRLVQYSADLGVRTDLGFDFLSEEALIAKIADTTFVSSYQEDFDHFATSGSVRFLLNAAVPLVVNSVTPFMDIQDAAVYVDNIGSDFLGKLLRDESLYAESVSRVARFSGENTIDLVYKRLLASLDYDFDQCRDGLKRHVYFHRGLLAPANVLDAERFLVPNGSPIGITSVLEKAERPFTAVPPPTVQGLYLDTFEQIGSRDFLFADADPLAAAKPNEISNVAHPSSTKMLKKASALRPPRSIGAVSVPRVLAMPGNMRRDYILNAFGYAIDADKVAAVEAGDQAERLEKLLKDGGIDYTTDWKSVINDIPCRSVFYSSEIDELPVAERAYAVALMLDRKVPDQQRFQTFYQIFEQGLRLADLVGTSEMENALITVIDDVAGSPSYNPVKSPGSCYRSDFWQRYVARRYRLSSTPSMEREDISPRSKPAAPRHAPRAIEGLRYRYPLAALESLTRFANDRPWLEVGQYSLGLRNAKVLTSSPEFCSKWSAAKFVDGNRDEFPMPFDVLILHKDARQYFTPKLEKTAGGFDLLFANEVFFIIAPAHKVTHPYRGEHMVNFPTTLLPKTGAQVAELQR